MSASVLTTMKIHNETRLLWRQQGPNTYLSQGEFTSAAVTGCGFRELAQAL